MREVERERDIQDESSSLLVTMSEVIHDCFCHICYGNQPLSPAHSQERRMNLYYIDGERIRKLVVLFLRPHAALSYRVLPYLCFVMCKVPYFFI